MPDILNIPTKAVNANALTHKTPTHLWRNFITSQLRFSAQRVSKTEKCCSVNHGWISKTRVNPRRWPTPSATCLLPAPTLPLPVVSLGTVGSKFVRAIAYPSCSFVMLGCSGDLSQGYTALKTKKYDVDPWLLYSSLLPFWVSGDWDLLAVKGIEIWLGERVVVLYIGVETGGM
jgi:hypothetical protein